MIMQLSKDAFTVTLVTAMPLLGISLVVGVLVSVFQAATQIQEMTLSFVPKVLAVGVAGVLFGPWVMNNLIVYTANLLSSLPNYAH
ncbi:MAG: flagellar biosynthesis protein FliQ [Chloroflexi bacterium]|nr:flagellar biosynthesis protein FliQ [Chloroflexota bacterium]